MKKLLIMALVVLGTSSAFAGDSDALKAIMKAKSYDDAASLLNANLNQLANAAEKAKAYNKLVDLAFEAYSPQDAIVDEIDIAKGLGKTIDKTVDYDVLYKAAYEALVNGVACDEFDQQPNEKGKVAPKYAEANVQRLWFKPRYHMVNAGQAALQKNNEAEALKYWSVFLDTDAAPLFANADRSWQAPFFGQVARSAAIFAYQAKNMDLANKYCDLAIKDEGEHDKAIALKILILKDGLTTRQDSLNYVSKLETLYNENPNNDAIVDNIYNMYTSLGEKEKASKVLDKVLEKDPQNFVALANKGVSAMSENKVDDALTYLRRAYEVKNDSPIISTYIGTCLCVKAQDLEDKTKRKALYEEAITYLDKAKELDPDKEQSRWGYNRYNAYYNLYGAEDPRTKAAEADQ